MYSLIPRNGQLIDFFKVFLQHVRLTDLSAEVLSMHGSATCCLIDTV